MEAHELMLGDYVSLYHKGTDCLIEDELIVKPNHISLFDKMDLRPTDLTEQWLKDFEYSLNGNGLYCNESLAVNTTKVSDAYVIYIWRSGWIMVCYCDKEVHTFQNLVFVLTGKKLKL